MPLANRIVEVIADLGVGARPRYRYGSGCIVRGRTVMTAAHLVVGAQTVSVRRVDKVLLHARADAAFIGGGGAPDMALIEIDDESIDLAPMELAQVDRDSAAAVPVEGRHAVGFPQFAERGSRPAVRDTVDAWGHIPVLSKLDSGLLTVQVTAAPRALPPERTVLGSSEWSGMSGAPVVANGCLVGIVSEHATREGPSAITAVPLTSLEHNPAHPRWGRGVANAPEWWQQLGVVGQSELRKLPEAKARPEPVYRATVRTIHERTPQLLGRGRELAELADFATGTDGYRWLTGAAWAGKTALIAEAVMAVLPSSVDVVVYFLSPGEADADSGRFLASVVPQLAYLLEAEPSVADLHQFRDLWYRAAERAAELGRHMLLAVDGVDEDLRPQGLPSVASLLPFQMPANTHLLITSRTNADIDLPDDHPLRATAQVRLEPSAFTPGPTPPKLTALIRDVLLPVRDMKAFYVVQPSTGLTGIPTKILARYHLNADEDLLAIWRLGSAWLWGNSNSIAFTTDAIHLVRDEIFRVPYSRFLEFEFKYDKEWTREPRQMPYVTYWMTVEGPGVKWSSGGFVGSRVYEPVIVSGCLNDIKKLVANHAEKALKRPAP